AGLVTGATIRILDITGGEDVPHRPLIEAVVHPLSAIAEQPVEFLVTSSDYDSQDLTITWSTDCADAAFSAPGFFLTQFTKATPGGGGVGGQGGGGPRGGSGSCRVVGFGPDPGQGGGGVRGEFVSAPELFIDVYLPDDYCSVHSHSPDGTCAGSIAAPERAI